MITNVADLNDAIDWLERQNFAPYPLPAGTRFKFTYRGWTIYQVPALLEMRTSVYWNPPEYRISSTCLLPPIAPWVVDQLTSLPANPA